MYCQQAAPCRLQHAHVLNRFADVWEQPYLAGHRLVQARCCCKHQLLDELQVIHQEGAIEPTLCDALRAAQVEVYVISMLLQEKKEKRKKVVVVL
jgi:hypothetical protein